MPCVVYCLVPDPEQLDPLVERIKDAGVKTEDIAVVPRRHWPPPPSSSPQHVSPFADSYAFAPYLWGLSMTPAAIWWKWAFGSGQSAAWPHTVGGHAVIPLEVYENKLETLRRK